MVFTDDNFGRSMKDLVLRETYSRGICVPHVIAMPDTGTAVNIMADRLRPVIENDVIGVVYAGSEMNVPELFQALGKLDQSRVNRLQWVFPWSKFSKPFNSPLFRGSLSVATKSKFISEFADYFTSINPQSPQVQNPWFQEWYMFTNKCKFNNATNPLVQSYSPCIVPTSTERRAAFTQDESVEQVIKAVYLFANALRRARNDKCLGSVQTFCTSFAQMTPAEFLGYMKTGFTFSAAENLPSLSGTSVLFDDNLDLATFAGFDVYNFNNRSGTGFQFQSIGSYTRPSGLSLNTAAVTMYDMDRVTPLASIPPSECTSHNCSYCTLPPSRVHFSTYPANSGLFIGGIFSIHTSDPLGYTCDQFDVSGAMHALPYFYALDRAKQKYPELNLEGLFIDSCNRGEYVAGVLNSFMSNIHPAMDQKGRRINPGRVLGYVDGSSSKSAFPVALTLNSLHVPDVGSMATVSHLQDSMEFPFYRSTVPPDTEQARAMVHFLSLAGFSYIQTVYRADEYGRQGQMDFKMVADTHSLCIAGSYELGRENDADDIMNMIQQNPSAKTLVVFGYGSDVREIFEAMQRTGSEGDFVVFASAGWGETPLPVELDDVATGSFTLSLQTSPLAGFTSYLQSLNVGSTGVPFYSNLYEEAFSCSLDPQYMRGYPSECDRTQKLNNNPKAFTRVHQTTAQFTIQAVDMVAQAIAAVVQDVCASKNPCSAFYDLPDARQRIMENIKAIKPTSPVSYTYQVLNYRPKQGQKFVPVASYDPADRVTSLGSNSLVFPNNQSVHNMASRCTGFCQQCSYLVAKQPYIMKRGDIMIGALVGMSKKDTNPFVCQTAKAEDGFQYAAAIQYAINQINSNMSRVKLNNVRLGTLIIDDCDSADRAHNILGGLYTDTFRPDGIDLDNFRGWLTYSSDSTIGSGKFLGNLGVPVISPFASALELRDRNDFPSLYLTVPRIDSMVSALVQVVRALGFSYIQLVYSPTAYGKSGMEELEQVSKPEGICVVSTYELGYGNNSHILNSLKEGQTNVVVVIAEHSYYSAELNKLASALNPNKYLFITSQPMKLTAAQVEISVVLEEPPIPDFSNFLATQGGHFFIRYFQERFQCKLPGAFYSPYQATCPGSVTSTILSSATDANVLATIDAVEALADAIHRTLQEMCGVNYDEVCSKFEVSMDTNSKILQKLDSVSFDGKRLFQNRMSPRNMKVLQKSGNDYTKVGSFSSGYLTLMDSSPQKRALLQNAANINSTCISPCERCIEKSLNFTFIPGDIYLGGMFDVHTRSISPFTCGKVKTLHGFQLLEAFQFAVDRVNNKMGSFSDKLKGVTLGAIGMDSCESAVRTGYQVSNIHNGMFSVKKNGYEVDPSEIKAYVAAYESDRTKYLARILGSLEIPQVSYGATSIELSDKDRYPFFIRTVPSDDHQADAVLAFLNKKNMRYVQILSSPTDYGRLGSKAFIERAERHRICVAQSVVFPDNGTVTRESASDAVTTMLDKPLANIVVIFADTGYLNEFLMAVKKNVQANKKFRFVGSIMWSLNFQMDPSVVETTLGAVTLNLESKDMKAFDDYLKDKTPANYLDNPWFDEYYEEIRNCYLRNPLGEFFRNKPSCGTEFSSIVSASRYIQDPGVLHVVNAVYASAHGIHYALTQHCGSNYTGVCELFRSSPSTNELIFKGIEMARFKDDTGANFEFTNRRDGNKGYTLYSIEESTTNSNGYVYNSIGTYSNQSGLEMETYESDWEGSCDRPSVCTECPGLRDSVTRYVEGPPGNDVITATIIGVFDLHRSRSYDEFLCGEMNYDTVFYNIMAFFYTIEKLINNQPGFSSKVKINGLAIDTCSSNIRVDSDLYGLLSGKGLCHTDTDLSQKLGMSNIAGVLTLGEDNTFAANRVLSPLAIGMISPDASSLLLRNTERYDYLLRASPPSTEQAMAILAILRKHGWDYVSVVYTDNGFGTSLYSTFRKYAAVDGVSPVCLGLSLSVPEEASADIYQSVVQELDENGKKGARAVVLFTTKQATSRMIRAIKSARPTTKFILIGTDAWSVDAELLRNQETFLEGTITLTKIKPQVQKFKEYFAENMNKGDQKLLPRDWYEEWYQHAHKCHLADGSTIISLRDKYPLPCQGNLILNATAIHHDANVFHTILSTYSIAAGLSDAAKECINATLEECMRAGGYAFRSRIFTTTHGLMWSAVDSKVNTDSVKNFNFTFNKMRYGNTGYTVNSVQYGDMGRLEYQKVGNWTSTLVMGDLSHYDDIRSVCLLKNKCSCTVFGPTTGALTGASGYEGLGDLPRNYYDIETTVYSNGTVGYRRRFDWPIWAIVLGILTSLGILVCLFLFVILLACYPIKTGTTILGFLLLVGIIGIYAINFAFFLPASVVTCGARRFVMGIVYAICFAALLVKAADNWRYGEFDTAPKKYKGITSAIGLLLIALFLIFIQVIIPIMWLTVDEPAAFLLSDSVIPHDYWWCGPPPFYDLALVLSFIYVMILVILTIIFAVLAWFNQNNYYESRWILGVSISTAGILMVWMIVSTMAAVPYRDAAVAVGNWVNATLLLICLPLRKTFLLFRILRNGSEDDMSEKDSKINGYSTEFVNTTFDVDDYQYNSKSMYSMTDKSAVYSTQDGQVVLKRAPEADNTVHDTDVTDLRQRETGEQTASMLIGEEDMVTSPIVVESSGSAAVAAEAPTMEGQDVAVARLGGDEVETSTHVEIKSSYKQAS
ncbi:uncharacterized protein LOC135476193 isoform X2 [Liolophura sinensis]|uniref:uncharacterized protein LOC135476193 isoform X2 n=1 Tax=Liolophura sinensis TaxID=3198878 RepID=UPI003158366D